MQTKNNGDLNAFILAYLPSLNNAVLRGELSPESFLDAIREPVSKLVSASELERSRDGARMLLGQFGMLLNSAERHIQAAGAAPGAALAQFTGADSALLHLGKVGQHPPRDSAYTYWMWNRAGYSFTGDRQEHLFQETVISIVEGVDDISRLLRFVASTPLTSPDSIRYMKTAVELQEVNHHLLGNLAKHDPAMRAPVFSGYFFTYNMRTWLTSFPVGGTVWPGTSAANFAEFWESDLRLTAQEFYRTYIEGRIHTVPDEEQSRVRTVMMEATIEDRILSKLGINGTQALTLDDATIHGLIHVAGISEFLAVLDRYVTITTNWTRAHVALVGKKLDETARAGTHVTGKVVVDPNRGTGGGDWRKELADIFGMRANPTILLHLFKINRQISSHQPEGVCNEQA